MSLNYYLIILVNIKLIFFYFFILDIMKKISSKEIFFSINNILHEYTKIDNKFDNIIQIKECKICLSENLENQLISPCLCKGSLQYVHVNCLEYYHYKYKKDISKCEICGYEYQKKSESNYRLIYKLTYIYYTVIFINIFTTIFLFDCDIFSFIIIGLFLYLFKIIFEFNNFFKSDIDLYLPEKYNLSESDYQILLNVYKNHLFISYIFVITYKVFIQNNKFYTLLNKNIYKIFYLLHPFTKKWDTLNL